MDPYFANPAQRVVEFRVALHLVSCVSVTSNQHGLVPNLTRHQNPNQYFALNSPPLRAHTRRNVIYRTKPVARMKVTRLIPQPQLLRNRRRTEFGALGYRCRAEQQRH